MESKNILIVGVWAFVIIWLVGMLLLRGDLLIALLLFVIAVGVSFAAAALPGGRQNPDQTSQVTPRSQGA